MVRADQHDGNHPQLHHAGHVPAVQRHWVRHPALPHPPGLRPLHLRLLRRGDGDQGDRHGVYWQAGLPGGDLEQARLFHSLCRVSLFRAGSCATVVRTVGWRDMLCVWGLLQRFFFFGGGGEGRGIGWTSL